MGSTSTLLGVVASVDDDGSDEVLSFWSTLLALLVLVVFEMVESVVSLDATDFTIGGEDAAAAVRTPELVPPCPMLKLL